MYVGKNKLEAVFRIDAEIDSKYRNHYEKNYHLINKSHRAVEYSIEILPLKMKEKIYQLGDMTFKFN
jgi:hypothetical protein